MKIVDPGSLAATLDAVNEQLAAGNPISAAETKRVVAWISARQGLLGSYAGMFAPLEGDFAGGIKVFTGESAGSRAGIAHVLGEEACRALIMLGVRDAPGGTVTAPGGTPGPPAEALERAQAGIRERAWNSGSWDSGRYCCGKCSAAWWRHVVVSGWPDAEAALAAGMRELKARRDGAGKWRPFPFWYTLLAIHEIGLPEAVAEMRYAAPLLERALGRKGSDSGYGGRRRELARRVLGRI